MSFLRPVTAYSAAFLLHYPKRVFAACTVHIKATTASYGNRAKSLKTRSFGNHPLRGQQLLSVIRHHVATGLTGHYQGSDSQSLVCHRGGPGSIPQRHRAILWVLAVSAIQNAAETCTDIT
jgi:hypothetical protein